jgi:magnesium-dependent phosphatase 1
MISFQFVLILCISNPVFAFQPPRSLPQRSRTEKTAFSALPKLIVFDLDNTLWTPELYQLRKFQRANMTPRAGKDVKLMEGTKTILEKYVPKLQEQGVQFGIASRTKSVEWAHSLLGQFGLTDIMYYVEIFPGNKKSHFQNIKDASGFDFDEMLFFDDARDGKYGNCEPVSEMGVLSVHCPNGLDSEEVFTSALDKYREWDRSPNHIVEWDGSVTNTAEFSNERITGVIKLVKIDKRYGFIQYRDGKARDIFFHFNSLSDKECHVDEGDEVSFQIKRDPKNGKFMAADITLEKAKDENTVQMRCFSMNMPFVALLANGYKTLETRNGTMFTQYAEGTQMLLHVGRRTYPDGDRHIDVMKSGGLSDEEIEELKKLPQGFGRGNAVAIVELGRTYETTTEERSEPEFQRNVAAFGADSGRIVTEIKRAAYLKKPVRLSGQGGVFKVQIDPEVIPDGWRVPSNEPSNGLYASISG